jgi:hypothetical protein
MEPRVGCPTDQNSCVTISAKQRRERERDPQDDTRDQTNDQKQEHGLHLSKAIRPARRFSYLSTHAHAERRLAGRRNKARLKSDKPKDRAHLSRHTRRLAEALLRQRARGDVHTPSLNSTVLQERAVKEMELLAVRATLSITPY